LNPSQAIRFIVSSKKNRVETAAIRSGFVMLIFFVHSKIIFISKVNLLFFKKISGLVILYLSVNPFLRSSFCVVYVVWLFLECVLLY